MPLIATRGAASAQGFGEFAQSAAPVYIEDVFSTWLYTGNVTPLAITNGIDLSTKGGLIWTKERNNTASHLLIDSQRGLSGGFLRSNTTDAADTSRVSESISSFNTDGYSLHAPDTLWDRGSYNYVSWTFRKQPKFFDIVTWTGNGVAGRQISHSLGSVPACIIVKGMETTNNWPVYHQSLGNTKHLNLNTTDSQLTSDTWNNTSPTATEFTIGSLNSVNQNGYQFVAYLFAHDAGGFGLTGTDNVISCGSFTTNGSGNATVSLGYEPQWVLVKGTGSGFGWSLFDNMRGMPVTGDSRELLANSSSAEGGIGSSYFNPTATGFYMGAFSANQAYIYIAIRRGPMKVPTSGTSVFSPNISSGSTGTVITTNFPVDMQINAVRDITFDKNVVDRLRGVITTPTDTLATRLRTNLTNAEGDNFYSRGWNNTGFQMPTTIADASDVFWSFRRAPSFFDEVCYSGNSVAGRTLTHNLGVTPQLIIVKARTIDVGWAVYAEPAGNTKYSELNDVTRFTTGINCWNDTSPTASVFSLSSNARVNRTGDTYVAYLFATCAGVSKVGSYTGTGSLQTINCGFTSGARFVLIKNQNVNGDWYVWDSARGISSSNDPYLLLNSTAAEVTNTNYVDTDSTGFKVTGNTAINTSSDTYIFLAIA